MGPQHRLGSIAVSGRGQKGAFGRHEARTISMTGVTHYDFQPETYAMAETALSQGRDCDGCEGRDCVRVSAPVTITYTVALSVDLPSVGDYNDLTECEAQNVQTAIDTVLVPHEQQHVDALGAYNGTETVTFSDTFCRSEIAQAVADFVAAREATRQANAIAASEALDPFNFTFDASEGCEEEATEDEPPGPEGPETEPPEEVPAPEPPAAEQEPQS
jgi:hypothetical protein